MLGSTHDRMKFALRRAKMTRSRAGKVANTLVRKRGDVDADFCKLGRPVAESFSSLLRPQRASLQLEPSFPPYP